MTDVSRPQGVDKQIVTLTHAGKALQTFGVELFDNVPVVLLRTLVPVGNAVLSLVLFSPNVGIKNTLARLFETVAGTVKVEEDQNADGDDSESSPQAAHFETEEE